MSDKLILIHGNNIYQADAAEDGGVEKNLRLAVKTKGFSPVGLFGDVVFRRVSLTLSHEQGYMVYVTPILDGRPLYGNTSAFSSGRPASGVRETVVLDIPLGVHYRSNGQVLSKGARGSNIQLYIETYPTANKALMGPVHLESVQILYAAGHVSSHGAAEAGGGHAPARSVGSE